MGKLRLAALALTASLLAASVCGADWGVTDKGTWPESWPAELEPLRSQARTHRHDSCTMYQIPFTHRAQFEAAWPHFLSIATDDSPLTLSRGQDRWTAIDFDAGVVVFTPNTGELIVPRDKGTTIYPRGAESHIPEGTSFLKVGPPWPDEIRDQLGRLPEYVVRDGLTWRAVTAQEMQDNPPDGWRVHRARTEIRLIVDGEVVDLNRIQLPASVIDKRFETNPNP